MITDFAVATYTPEPLSARQLTLLSISAHCKQNAVVLIYVISQALVQHVQGPKVVAQAYTCLQPIRSCLC